MSISTPMVPLVPAALGDDPGQVVHRMAFGGLNIVVRIADDVVVGEIGGALGAVGVLAAAIPDRLAVGRHQHALVHIERPAVIAGQPGHVGRIGDDQQIDAGSFHGLARLREPLGIFRSAEVEIGLRSRRASGWFLRIDGPSSARFHGAVAGEGGDGGILHAGAGQVAEGDGVSAVTARDLAGDHLAELSERIASGAIKPACDGVMQFAEAPRLGNAVGDIESARARTAGSISFLCSASEPMAVMCWPGWSQSAFRIGCSDGRRGDDDVRSVARFLRRRDSLNLDAQGTGQLSRRRIGFRPDRGPRCAPA